jgi:hypothetical protein
MVCCALWEPLKTIETICGARGGGGPMPLALAMCRLVSVMTFSLLVFGVFFSRTLRRHLQTIRLTSLKIVAILWWTCADENAN